VTFYVFLVADHVFSNTALHYWLWESRHGNWRSTVCEQSTLCELWIRV